MAAYRAKAIDAASNTSYEMLCFPTPDQDYAATLRYKINPLNMRGVGQLPIGDRAHTQTIISACLASAEDFDSRPGVHTERFIEHLRASINHDLQVNCPRVLGRNLDRSDGVDWAQADWRALSSYVVTIGGVNPPMDGT